ncbi:putative bifunctional diguanylate cyclase/phosphodiesterase [Methylopila musalis]|uniref:Bifunctional diguanylate cyclase/phosphodiesterase n=1 Tax=Methylopila musalis TaxID=1134781 RepID=A0ABW3Z9R2_9HYPH
MSSDEAAEGVVHFALALLAHGGDAIVGADASGVIRVWNDAACRMFGYSRAEAVGRSLDIIVPDAMRTDHAAGMRRLVRGEPPRLIGQVLELPARRADGEVFPAEVNISFAGEGEDMVFAAVIRDASERRRAEDRLQSLAMFDQLTLLANRARFIERLDEALAGLGRAATLLVIDLDRFSDLNDIEGHVVGDEILRDTALKLKRIALAFDSDGASAPGVVGRLGSNSFGLLLPDTSNLAVVFSVAEQVRSALLLGCPIRDRVVKATASIGIAVAPEHGPTAVRLMANADFALRRAKSEGCDARQMFSSSHRQEVAARRALEADLRQAAIGGQFELFFQPQVRLEDGALTGAEALLRWRHPTRGLLSPAQFLDVLAGSSAAASVGDWILNTACARAEQWRAAVGGRFRIGVNLFEAQFAREDIDTAVARALRVTGLPADALEIEITENVFTASDDVAVARVRRLRDLGVRIAFDDFGTGYASLNLLKRYPITRLKIDRSFVRNISDAPEDEAIVELVLQLGERFGLDVIAEGVERADQEEHLRRLGCREGQGFLYGRPMPADEFGRVFVNGGAADQAAVRRSSS